MQQEGFSKQIKTVGQTLKFNVSFVAVSYLSQLKCTSQGLCPTLPVTSVITHDDIHIHFTKYEDDQLDCSVLSSQLAQLL